MALKLLLPLLITLHLNGAHSVQALPRQNAVETSNIIIVNKSKQWPAFGTAGQLQQAFGNATVKKEADEVLGGFGNTYNYHGLAVYFHSKACESININGPEYRVLVNGHIYKVGDNVIKLKEQFPISYKNRRVEKDGLISLSLTHNKVMMDAYIGINYNIRGLITGIEIANDNS